MQLWNPWKANDIPCSCRSYSMNVYKQNLEISYPTWNYHEKLNKLKLYTLRKRLDRYIILYIWKIIQHIVQNIYGTMGCEIKTRNHSRHWTLRVLDYSTNRSPAQSVKENAITVLEHLLYNLLLKIWYIESVNTEHFTFVLGKLVELIPDYSILFVIATRSNSILDQLSHQWAQGIYNPGVSDSAVEQPLTASEETSTSIAGMASKLSLPKYFYHWMCITKINIMFYKFLTLF